MDLPFIALGLLRPELVWEALTGLNEFVKIVCCGALRDGPLSLAVLYLLAQTLQDFPFKFRTHHFYNIMFRNKMEL